MKRRQLLMVLGIAMLTMGSLSSPQAARADALSDIAASGTLRVAVPQDFPPFGSVGTDMAPMGYDIDMANLIAEKLGVKTELVPVTSANRIPYLQTNKVDLVISSLGKNAEREKVIDFTDAYAPFFNGVFGPADVAVAKAEDLSGKTVGVTRGAVEDLELTKIAPPDATIKRYEDNNGTISAFLSGQVDLIATGNVVAAAILRKQSAEAAGDEVPDQELALLRRPEQERAGTAGEGQRHHRRRQGRRNADRDIAEMAGRRPSRRLLINGASVVPSRAMARSGPSETSSHALPFRLRLACRILSGPDQGHPRHHRADLRSAPCSASRSASPAPGCVRWARAG